MSTLYEILNVSKDATPAEIKSAYKKLALQFHPDKCSPSDREKNEVEFKKIKSAYEVLSNADRKLEYDMQQSGEVHHTFGGFHNLFSFFGQHEQMFNITVRVTLTLEEVYKGVVKNIVYERNETCSGCNGVGFRDSSDKETCTHCSGSGAVQQMLQMGFMQHIVRNMCNACKGKGVIIVNPCKTCDGAMYEVRSCTVNLKFPRGTKDGDTLVLKNKGHYYKQYKMTSDLIIITQIEPHPTFTRVNKNDLAIRVDISLVEALRGFKKSVVFLDGTNVDIVSTSIVKPSSTMTMPDRGLNRNGSLIITFHVVFPEDVDTFMADMVSLQPK
jgi:DnaJ-class molecular chaperone